MGLIRGDALALPLADNSVDLVVTSPPYFGLRSYRDGGEHYGGQIGAEPTPAAFVTALLAATREMVRVVKPDGSIWVNLGDKYARSGGVDRAQRGKVRPGDPGGRAALRQAQKRPTGIPEKSLIGIPWRYAIACVDELGLILRAEVIWDKPNGMPESVTDRVRRSHEQWFHFTRSARYYSALDNIRDEFTEPQGGLAGTFKRPQPSHDLVPGQSATQQRNDRPDVPASHPLGRIPGSVWSIPSQPLVVPASLGVDHFAAFPMEWPRRLIQGWSPARVCTACGQGRAPVTEPTGERGREPGGGGTYRQMREPGAKDTNLATAALAVRTITGESCGCPEPSAATHPGIVLDPFGGTGTTALVADALGRRGISLDMSADYCRLARWRTTDDGERARARLLPRPPKQAEGQGVLDIFL